MKTDRIADSIIVAERFIMRAQALIKARGLDQDIAEHDYPREQGSLKRGSLDLTRSLAIMRRRS